MELHIRPDPPLTSIIFRTIFITLFLGIFIAVTPLVIIFFIPLMILKAFINEFIAYAIGVIFLTIPSYFLARRSFRSVEYVLTDDEIRMITPSIKQVVPYTQIQNVILYTNPAKKKRGVADVHIYTMNGETIQLADIHDAERILKLLKERIRGE